MPEVVVAGAGMAGLVAAARARELGASVTVREKGERPGGSFLYSSAFVWRYRDWDTFRAQCPGGDPELQRAVFDQLDDALAWLECARRAEHVTGDHTFFVAEVERIELGREGNGLIYKAGGYAPA